MLLSDALPPFRAPDMPPTRCRACRVLPIRAVAAGAQPRAGAITVEETQRGPPDVRLLPALITPENRFMRAGLGRATGV